MSVNKVILLGRLGKDPELKNNETGMTIAKFSLATSEKYKDKQGQQHEKTEWHNVVAFGKQAEVCGQYLSKGRQVFIEGSIRTRTWEKDGKKNYMTEIIVKSLSFISDGQQGGQNQGGLYQNNQNQGGQYRENHNQIGRKQNQVTPTYTVDDIPF